MVNAVLVNERLVFSSSKNLLILNACLIKECHCDFAVWTGCGLEEVNSVIGIALALFLSLFLNNYAVLLKLRGFDVVNCSILILLSLTVVPVLNRTVVTGNTAINLSLFATLRAGVNLTGDVTVVLTYGVCWGHCVVWELIVFSNLANKVSCTLPCWELFTKECVEYCS